LLTNTGVPGTVGNWVTESIDSSYSWQVLVGDFDNDGHLDIFHGIDYGPIHMFYGDGAGNFVAGADVADPDTEMRFLRGFNAADLNDDGLLDLIGVDGSFLRAFLNPGNRVDDWESVGPDTPVGDYPCCDTYQLESGLSPSAADLDGDGTIDQVAFLGSLGAKKEVKIVGFRGSKVGDALQWTYTELDAIWGYDEPPGFPAHAGTADLNGDGYLDVHVGGGDGFDGLVVLVGDNTGDFHTVSIPLDHGVGGNNSFVVGDINGDGGPDIVTSRYTEADGLNSGFEVLYGPKPRIGDRITRISELAGSGQLNGSSFDPSISDDGRYVAYATRADNAVEEDYGALFGVIIHDRVAGGRGRIIYNNEDTYVYRRPSISGNGRYVAFEQEDIDSPDFTDILLWDLQTDKFTLVGQKKPWLTDDQLLWPALSGDGRYVAFQSAATNLVDDDTNGVTDIFLWDSQTKETVRVSTGEGDTIASGGSNPAISHDGQFILYEGNTYFQDDYECPAILLYDRDTGQTDVLVENDCEDDDYTVHSPALAPSGDFAAYVESCYECDPVNTIDTIEVVGLRGQPGYTIRNSRTWPDDIDHPSFMNPSLSADGNFVTFMLGPNIIAPGRIFVYDHAADEMTQVTRNAAGETGDHDSTDPVISANGRFIAFASAASNLVPHDTNGTQDVFVYDQRITYDLIKPVGVLDAGEHHTCALTPQGRAECWGAEGEEDYHGQAEDRDGPFLQVGAGAIHSCGLRPNGSVACWGGNEHGQAEDRDGPFAQLSVGGDTNCGLRPDGTIECWGWAGLFPPEDKSGPFSQISAGVLHSCGLTVAGNVQCWGYNDWSEAEDRVGPFTQVVVGYWHTCALRPDGSVACWGDNLYGQNMDQAGPFLQLTAGAEDTCGLRPDNSVACWGASFLGAGEDQIGPYVQISSHYAHTCGLTPDGRVDCWGWNVWGQAEDQPGPFGPFRPFALVPVVLGG
jgi:Tol biopolymer transport system component